MVRERDYSDHKKIGCELVTGIEISIVIPAYNAERWIDETLRSVDVERWDGVEVIVVDDGSTDRTAEIVQSCFPWARLESQANQGCSAARTRGTELSTGKYIKYLDSDDLLVAGVLRRQLDLAESTGADVVYGNWQRLVQRSDGNWVVGERVIRRIEDVSEDRELAFFTDMWCTTAAYMWRRSFQESCHPGWHRNLPVIQDARFALDAAMANAKFTYDSGICASYRVQTSDTVSTRSRLAFHRDCFENCLEIYRLWDQQDKLTPARTAAVLGLCEEVGLSTYPIDKELGGRIFAFAKSIDHNWRPRSTFVRATSTWLLDVPHAAQLIAWCGRIRAALGRIRRRSNSLRIV